MSAAFNFQEDPFEFDRKFEQEEETEFDQRNFDSVLVDSEWEGEILRGLPFPPHRHDGLPTTGSSPTADAEHTVVFQAPFRRVFTSAIVLGHRVEGEPASCTCPLHRTEFVRSVQSSVNQVRGYGFRCGMGSEWIFRG